MIYYLDTFDEWLEERNLPGVYSLTKGALAFLVIALTTALIVGCASADRPVSWACRAEAVDNQPACEVRQ